jgi:hypothetical protein
MEGRPNRRARSRGRRNGHGTQQYIPSATRPAFVRSRPLDVALIGTPTAGQPDLVPTCGPSSAAPALPSLPYATLASTVICIVPR